MKKVKVFILLLVITMAAFIFKGAVVKADEIENVSVNIPASIDVVFNEDGTTSVSEFTVSNQTLLPFSVKKSMWLRRMIGNCVHLTVKSRLMQNR